MGLEWNEVRVEARCSYFTREIFDYTVFKFAGVKIKSGGGDGGYWFYVYRFRDKKTAARILNAVRETILLRDFKVSGKYYDLDTPIPADVLKRTVKFYFID